MIPTLDFPGHVIASLEKMGYDKGRYSIYEGTDQYRKGGKGRCQRQWKDFCRW